MSTIEEIEQAVSRLEPTEYVEFRRWLSDYDNQKWDRKLNDDSHSGRLDKLAEEALRDLAEGHSTDL